MLRSRVSEKVPLDACPLFFVGVLLNAGRGCRARPDRCIGSEAEATVFVELPENVVGIPDLSLFHSLVELFEVLPSFY